MDRKACPYCCHPSFDHVPPPYPNQHRSREEINRLHEQIRQLDESVAELSRRRTALLRELNEVQPPIGTLPGETLSLIFQFACALPRFGAFLPPKEAVVDDGWCDIYSDLHDTSVRWRRALLSTPQLWTNASLFFKKRNMKSKTSFLTRLLENSGDLPLTLSLHFHKEIALPAETLVDPTVDDLLRKNFSRIKELHLTSPSPAWHSGSLPQLTQAIHVSLKDVRRSPLVRWGAMLERQPLVGELTLVAAPIELPSSCAITVLNLAQMRLNVTYHIVVRCPNLIELYITSPLYMAGPDPDLPTQRFSLKHLEILEWVIFGGPHAIADGPWQIAILRHIYVPSLRMLHWSHHFSMNLPNHNYRIAAEEFFAKLPATLNTIGLEGIKLLSESHHSHIPDTVNRLHDDTCVERLNFTDCHARILIDILQELIPRDDGTVRFPYLREITMDIIIWPTAAPSESSDAKEDACVRLSLALVKTLERRMEGRNDRFTLRMSHLSDEDWLCELEMQRSLIQLINRGYNVDVLVVGEQTSWLWAEPHSEAKARTNPPSVVTPP